MRVVGGRRGGCGVGAVRVERWPRCCRRLGQDTRLGAFVLGGDRRDVRHPVDYFLRLSAVRSRIRRTRGSDDLLLLLERRRRRVAPHQARISRVVQSRSRRNDRLSRSRVECFLAKGGQGAEDKVTLAVERDLGAKKNPKRKTRKTLERQSSSASGSGNPTRREAKEETHADRKGNDWNTWTQSSNTSCLVKQQPQNQHKGRVSLVHHQREEERGGA